MTLSPEQRLERKRRRAEGDLEWARLTGNKAVADRAKKRLEAIAKAGKGDA